MEHSLMPLTDKICMLMIALLFLAIPFLSLWLYKGLDDSHELYDTHELPDADGNLEAGREFLASEFVEVGEDE